MEVGGGGGLASLAYKCAIMLPAAAAFFMPHEYVCFAPLTLRGERREREKETAPTGKGPSHRIFG